MQKLKIFALIYLILNFHSSSSGIVQKVIDGDTLVVNGERVRLIGINAPERGEKCYSECKGILEDLTLGKKVTLEREIVNRDRYGRLLRHVKIGNIYVEELMLERGCAKTMCIFPNILRCEKLQEIEARVINRNEGCLYSSVERCVVIRDVSEKGDWVEIENTCNTGVNFTVENSGRVSVNGVISPGELKTVMIPIYPHSGIYVFSNGKFSDFRRV